jgi:maleate isomerase
LKSYDELCIAYKNLNLTRQFNQYIFNQSDNMKLNKIEPKYISKSNPRIGLITLATDFRIEKDFNNVLNGKDIDLYCNRIHCYNPLTNETLKKMADDITNVTKDILPDQKLDCVAYGCTSGTIAAGYNSIVEKVNAAKPNTKVTTPITAAIKALKKLNINKISIFTPYTNEINNSVAEYFKNENFEINELSYFDIPSDLDIGKVDDKYLFDVLSKIDLSDSDALFVSCTALPVLSLINDLEKKLGKFVVSSNQALIWDSLNQVNSNINVVGYGKLFNN